jgi:selenocysteine-specific elongation factor
LKGGSTATVQIRLESPVAAVAGDRFVIRRYSPAITIGGGVVLDAGLPKLSRGTRPEILETLTNGTLADRVVLMAKLEGLRGLTIESVQARTGVTVQALRPQLKDLPHLAAPAPGRWIHEDVIADFRRKSIEYLDRFFKSNKMAVTVPKGEFVQKLFPADSDPAIINYLMGDLGREKIVEVRGDVLEIPGRSKSLGGSEGELARAIEARFAGAGLQPPAVSEIIKTMTHKPKMIEGVISFLVKQGTLIRLAEGVYVHANVLTEARTRMAGQKGQTMDVGQFKEFFGLSRKIAIPLLELFDREGVTKRTGDVRQVL